MPEPEDEPVTFTRHRLIDSLMEVNQRQLRLESARFGVEIELARLARDQGPAAEVEIQARRRAELEREQAKLAAERAWLDSTLAELLAGDEGADEDPPGSVGLADEDEDEPRGDGGPVGRA